MAEIESENPVSWVSEIEGRMTGEIEQLLEAYKAARNATLDEVLEALTARKKSAYHADEFELLNELIEMVRGMKD